MMKDCKGISKVAAILSAVAVILSAIVSIGQIDLWLAGTQWMLVGIAFGIYAIYLGGCSCGCCTGKQE